MLVTTRKVYMILVGRPEDLGVEWILKKLDMAMGSGCIWL
jgi:hypothetical protein